MSYRYSALDIIVGVGMSAIMFGAILVFVATTGTFQAPQPVSAEPFSEDSTGMVWLQPALGQAIVDRMLLERRTNLIHAEAVSEWNRATMAYHDLQSLSGPFGLVAQMAATIPFDHIARVQGVMGRSIVNFTRQGVRSGVLSARLDASAYNAGMIRKAEAMGLRLDEAFASTWQATLGRAIVDAAQRYTARAAATQEQLGAAILRVTHTQAVSGEAQAANQQQLAGLIMAAVRTDALSDRLQLLAAIENPQVAAAATSTRPASWPEIPVGFLIAAVMGLGIIFFAGLIYSAKSREAKILADRNREMSRWVYRMAA